MDRKKFELLFVLKKALNLNILNPMHDEAFIKSWLCRIWFLKLNVFSDCFYNFLSSTIISGVKQVLQFWL